MPIIGDGIRLSPGDADPPQPGGGPRPTAVSRSSR